MDSLGRWALPLQQAAISAGDISLRNALRELLEGLPALVACFSNACRNAARLPVAVPVVPPPASRNVVGRQSLLGLGLEPSGQPFQFGKVTAQLQTVCFQIRHRSPDFSASRARLCPRLEAESWFQAELF